MRLLFKFNGGMLSYLQLRETTHLHKGHLLRSVSFEAHKLRLQLCIFFLCGYDVLEQMQSKLRFCIYRIITPQQSCEVPKQLIQYEKDIINLLRE